ncbi:MAG TPA: efflux RND transporter periplasmic adaptor subunit, partial [Steroidobacteraceae bacterium]|nr:efflux RND transporter periplasmic adaptor subunit [Steroidobacteraceae bacterium]
LCLAIWLAGCGSQVAGHASAQTSAPFTAHPNDTVELTAAQLRWVTLQTVTEHTFAPEQDAVGNIDFDEDMTVQVSPPYQGRIVRLLARQGDAVRQGQLLFTIDSPDLVQAESNLISSAGTLKLTDAALRRAQGLYAIQGIAAKDYEQAVSDQQAAEGAFRAARDAVRIFGKSESDMDRIVARRKVEAEMPVPSPINGVVTTRNAAPGMLVQPGASPAPYAVADLRSKWLLASVPEGNLPALRLGQQVDVRLLAYPERVFHGHITNIAESVDPNTHRATVRAEVADPGNELRPQMFATFTVHLGKVIHALAIPTDAVVREGDGTFSAWVTADGQRLFQRRTVHLGQQQNGFDQIIAGLRAGERIAAGGALFISNASIQGGAD